MDNNVKKNTKKSVPIITKVINMSMAASGGIVSIPFFFIAFLIIIVATCITLVISIFFGAEPNVDAIKDEEIAQKEMNTACAADVERTVNYMRDIYMDKSEDATMATREYVIQVLGEDSMKDVPDPDAGFLAGLKDFFGINKGGTDLTLKDWQYNDYENSNKIDMHFSKSYQEVAQTLYGYVSATISATDNFRTAYEQKKCTEEGNCEEDGGLECGENCDILEVLNALNSEKKDTVESVLKEQNNAENKDKVFYIDDTYTNWEDTLEMGEWEKRSPKEGQCTVYTESGKCPGYDDKEDYTETSRTLITTGTDPNAHGGVWEVKYTYTDVEEKSGPMGDVWVPIYLNTDEFLKDEKEEIIQLMVEDLEMTEIEAEDELMTYINGSFESSLRTCDFEPDYSMFGATSLIGVGNNGYIGSLDLGEFAKYQGMDIYDPYLNQLVWGEAYKFIDEGKISALKSHQCTTFVHWMFYKVYGYDCANGHGKQMAENLVKTNPNFVESNSPAPGAVASVRQNSTYGHVLFINAVFDDDGDGQWDRLLASDGNLDGTAADTGNDGVRIAHEWTREKWESYWGATYYAVPKQ